MKTLFTIGNEKNGSDTLLVELGQDHCSYAFLNLAAKSFQWMSYVSLEEFEDESKLTSLFAELRKEQVEKVVVCIAYPQAMFIPQNFPLEAGTLTSLIYQQKAQVLNDAIPEWQLKATYLMPVSLYETITSIFPDASFFHAYTPSLKIYNGFTATDQLDLHFTTQLFRVMVKKDQQLVLAQTYSYKTPLDVVYFLLKIFYELSLDQSAAFVIISGLIDRDSAMYQELHLYFLNIHFAVPPDYSIPNSQHPSYYFSSMYNLAACVS